LRAAKDGIRGRVAIVTGASSGIGRATAVALAMAGARVVAVGRTPSRVDDAVEEINQASTYRGGGARCTGLALDVRNEKDMEEMAARTLDEFGRIDILCAAAGSGGSRALARKLPYAVVQLPVEEWDEIIDTNLKGVFLSNRAVLPAMMAAGGGDIVNVSSSRGAEKGLPYAAAYSASKHGLMGLTEALAEEAARSGVRVQVVLPDVTETQMMHLSGDLAPHGLLKPAMVGGFIVDMIAAPDDTVIGHPLIMPFST